MSSSGIPAHWLSRNSQSAELCSAPSAADLKFLQRSQQIRLGTSNRRAALAPLLPKFASEVAAMDRELRKRGTRGGGDFLPGGLGETPLSANPPSGEFSCRPWPMPPTSQPAIVWPGAMP